jgi:hypothetical protein
MWTGGSVFVSDTGGTGATLKLAATSSNTYIESGGSSTSGSAATLNFTSMNASATWMSLSSTDLYVNTANIHLANGGTTYGWIHADSTPRFCIEAPSSARVSIATNGAEQFVVGGDGKIYSNAHMWLTDHSLYLRGTSDINHGLAYNGGSGGVDGPNLFGNTGGLLKTTNPDSIPLRWSAYGVGIWNTAPASGNAPLFCGYTATSYGSAFAFFTSSASTGTSGSSGTVNYSAQFFGRILVAGEVNVTSDVRLKKNIQPLALDFCKEFVQKARPVSFEWRSEDSGIKYGYIAQEVIKAGFPNFVAPVEDEELEEHIDEDDFMSVAGIRMNMAYDHVIPVLHVVTKDLVDENTALKQQVEAQQTQINALQAKLDALISALGVTL